MKTITLKHLRGACPDQVALFKDIFPDGAPVTEESALKAIKAGLLIGWLKHLIPKSALADYQRVTASALVKALREEA